MSLSLEQVPAQKQELRLNAQLLQSLRILHLPQPKLEAFIEQQAQENPFLQIEKRGTLKEYPVSPLSSPQKNRRSFAQPGQSDGTHLLEARSSFRKQLLDQVAELSYTDETERAMVCVLIESIDPSDGYLRTSITDLASEYEVDPDALEDALILLQDEIEPAGIGARNLQECLELQARRERASMPLLLTMIQEHMELAQSGGPDAICEVMDIDTETAENLLAHYHRLDTSPGRSLAPAPPMVSPDFEITVGDGGTLELHSLRSDSLIASVTTDVDHLYDGVTDHKRKKALRSMQSSAQALTSAIARRVETEREVVTEIVHVQRHFFTQGIQGLRPLTQREIAEAIGMHESTISRVVAGRYLLTPMGTTHELRDFFSRAIPTESGRAASSTTVKAMIKELVENESPSSRLSDNRIAQTLHDDHGIQIARRTVAKYRKFLKIPTSSQRRRRH